MRNHWQFAGALAAGLIGATAAHAVEHQVVLTGYTYFPAISYAAPGDTVRFINDSDVSQTVVARDAGWVVGPLDPAEEATLVVTEDMELSFFSAYAEDGEYGAYDSAPVRAEISFDAPPLTETVAPGQ
jgi:plastocyanin